ncbi:hypothetical protein QW060_12900 [Myroides ceti]|uniref:Uncharacterized protein n=1 Tax=Paenimyroides ceti TaxID=395087 RepID=A0ABT8CXX6_9FLAO|nr:hypothetical protein [Paenimyroides ceti]MDN3708007.1 hypothetical protein [Paenimyroides ceti]
MKKLIIMSIIAFSSLTTFAGNGDKAIEQSKMEKIALEINPHEEVLRNYHVTIFAQGYNSQFGEHYIIILYDETGCMTLLDIKNKVQQYQQSRPNDTITFKVERVAGSCSVPL